VFFHLYKIRLDRINARIEAIPSGKKLHGCKSAPCAKNKKVLKSQRFQGGGFPGDPPEIRTPNPLSWSWMPCQLVLLKVYARHWIDFLHILPSCRFGCGKSLRRGAREARCERNPINQSDKSCCATSPPQVHNVQYIMDYLQWKPFINHSLRIVHWPSVK